MNVERDILIGIFTGVLATLIFAFIPLGGWVESIPLLLRIAIVILLLFLFFVYKIYQLATNKVNVFEIKELEKLGLKIENQGILLENETIKQKNVIYFPVVPTSKPNIIHLLFAFYLRKLLSFGLYVHIFVFDDYCMRKDKNNQANVDSDVTNFIHVFKKYIGCKNNRRLTIIKKSSFIKSSNKSREVLISLLEKSSELKCREIKQIQQNKPINENEVFSRYMKPLYNMSFLSLTSKKYGFTLSGLDEKPLWDCFNKNFKVESYKLCNLYIPTIENTEARDTGDICHSANSDLILNKVKGNFANIDNIPENSNISLFLKILIFGDNKYVTYTSDNEITIKNWNKLIQSIKEANELDKENIYNSISFMINNLINGR